MTTERMEFDVSLKEVEVVLKDGSQEKRAVLRELTGEERDAYLNELASKVKYGDDGESSKIRNFKGIQSCLLKRCLFEVVDGGMKPFTEDMIQRLPSRVVNSLFEKAKELSAIGEEEEETGND